MWIRLRAVPMTFTAASTPAVHVGPRNVAGSDGSSRETRDRTAPMTALATSAELTHSPCAHRPATPRRPAGHRPTTPAAPCQPAPRQRYGCIHIGRALSTGQGGRVAPYGMMGT